MPANSKYLTHSPVQKTLKITAGFLGGYLVTASSHLCMMLWFDKGDILATMGFTAFTLWAFLLLFAFLAKNGWKIWGIYLGLSALFAIPLACQFYL